LQVFGVKAALDGWLARRFLTVPDALHRVTLTGEMPQVRLMD
jgi:hypothetical protein